MDNLLGLSATNKYEYSQQKPYTRGADQLKIPESEAIPKPLWHAP